MFDDEQEDKPKAKSKIQNIPIQEAKPSPPKENKGKGLLFEDEDDSFKKPVKKSESP